jgi:hypothetical protein
VRSVLRKGARCLATAAKADRSRAGLASPCLAGFPGTERRSWRTATNGAAAGGAVRQRQGSEAEWSEASPDGAHPKGSPARSGEGVPAGRKRQDAEVGVGRAKRGTGELLRTSESRRALVVAKRWGVRVRTSGSSQRDRTASINTSLTAFAGLARWVRSGRWNWLRPMDGAKRSGGRIVSRRWLDQAFCAWWCERRKQ